MSGRDLLALVTGTVVGAALAGVVWTVSRDPAPTDAAAAVSTTTTEPVWISTLEARIGPSVVVPTALEVSNGELLITYEVSDLLAADDETRTVAEAFGPGAAAAPARWTLIGPGFEVTQEAVAPTSRGIRFPLPAGFQPDATTVLRLDAYWLAASVDFELTIDRTSAAWYPIGPGLQARLAEAIQQADNAIVIVEVDGPQTLTDQMTIEGKGREWVSSSRSMLGSHRWTLDYRGDELPDPLPLVVRGVQWFEVEAALEFPLEAILP